MNKKIFLIGIVMIILGIALIAGGGSYFESAYSSHESSAYLENKTTGLNYSHNITLKSGEIFMVEDPVSNSGLVFSANLSHVTDTSNLSKNIAQAPTDSDSGIQLYIIAQSGTYSYVYFNSTSAPHYGYISGSQLDTMAALIIAGGIIGFIGFIIMLYGIFKKEKPKNPMASDDPYNIDNIKI
ncbi:MAG: hypothetical protein QXZ44_04420 [Ferroplasma sp.]